MAKRYELSRKEICKGPRGAVNEANNNGSLPVLHATPIKAYICKFCPRVFLNSRALGGHQNAHKKEKTALRLMMESGVFLPNHYKRPVMEERMEICSHGIDLNNPPALVVGVESRTSAAAKANDRNQEHINVSNSLHGSCFQQHQSEYLSDQQNSPEATINYMANNYAGNWQPDSSTSSGVGATADVRNLDLDLHL